MLILQRNAGQRVFVVDSRIENDPGYWIEVVQSRSVGLALGFDAPPEVQVWREELVTRDDSGRVCLP